MSYGKTIRIYVDGQLALADKIGHKDELPPGHLGAIRKIQILGQRRAVPTAGVIDRPPSKHTAGTVEVEEAPGEVPGRVFHHEMPVEKNRLYAGQERVVPVEVAPPRLDHTDLFILKIRNHPAQKIPGRDKIRVEHGDELIARVLQPVFERPRLKALTVLRR